MNENKTENVNIGIANIKNVGYDSTGRFREGSELITVNRNLRKAKSNGLNYKNIEIFNVSKDKSFGSLTDIFVLKSKKKKSSILKDHIMSIQTGRTPARSS